MAAMNFILQAAANLASIICGQVFASLGWLWLFHLFQIFLVLQFILMFLFCPETTYIRDSRLNTDVARDEEILGPHEMQKTHREGTEEVEEAYPETQITRSKKTFVQELAIFTGVYSDENVLNCLLGPFLTLLNPACCYAITTAAILNCWLVGSAIILSGLLSGPPWLFNAAQVGYMGTGPFIGGLIASIITAVFGDEVVKYVAKRNKGI